MIYVAFSGCSSIYQYIDYPASVHHYTPQLKVPDVEVLLPTFGFNFVEIAFDLYPTSIG